MTLKAHLMLRETGEAFGAAGELVRVLEYVNGQIGGRSRTAGDVAELVEGARIHLRQCGLREVRVRR